MKVAAWLDARALSQVLQCARSPGVVPTQEIKLDYYITTQMLCYY